MHEESRFLLSSAGFLFFLIYHQVNCRLKDAIRLEICCLMAHFFQNLIEQTDWLRERHRYRCVINFLGGVAEWESTHQV